MYMDILYTIMHDTLQMSKYDKYVNYILQFFFFFLQCYIESLVNDY